MRRHKAIATALVSAVFVFATILTLLWILNADRSEERHNRIESSSKITTLLVVIAGIAVAWYRSLAAHKQAETAEQGQITDRFTKAVDQLEDEKLAVRLGGIYALERIAHDSKRDHWTVMEVLCAYVRAERENPHGVEERDSAHLDRGTGDRLPIYIQAVLDVLKRRTLEHETDGHQLDLNNTALERAGLIGVNLERADLSFTDLTGAEIHQANLAGANLRYANLTVADLIQTDLRWADLRSSDLSEAHLTGSDLGWADLSGACLRETILYSANLNQAINLTQEQINLAIGDEETSLPEGLERPAYWTTSEPQSDSHEPDEKS